MKRISPFLLAAISILAPNAVNASSGVHNREAIKMRSGYAPVNGLKIYYEIYGDASPAQPPLVLLHGGGDTIQTSFGRLLPELAQHGQIIAFEQQGFGHTADIPDRPFTFEQSADDTAALLDYLHVAQADFFGFSNGGTIALQVAIRHPKIAHKLIVASGFFSRDGADPRFWAGFDHATLSDMPQELRDAYLSVSPHPENLQNFFDKCVDRMRNFKNIPDNQIRAITAPTLVIIGDSDVVRPEHAVALFRLLPHASLGVLSETDHMNVTSRSDLLMPMISGFLDAR